MTTTEPTADELAGMAWWNGLDKSERAYWLAEARSAVPAEAWATYQSRSNWVGKSPAWCSRSALIPRASST